MEKTYQIKTNGESIITVTGGIIANKMFENMANEDRYPNLELVMIDTDYDDEDNEIITERLIRKYENGEIETVDWNLNEAFLQTGGTVYCIANVRTAPGC